MSIPFLDTFQGRLRLEGVLETRTGLHIGAGGSGDPLATDAPVVRNAAGFPYIPGSSVKGVMRSAAEGLFPRVPSKEKVKPKLWTCDFLAGDPCVHHTVVKELREMHQEQLRDKFDGDELEYQVQRAVSTDVWTRSCTICRLFGSLALASRVRFPDLPLSGGMPLLEIRNGVGIDRDKELAASGVLYDFEAVPPGTKFDLIVILDNYRDAEAGLVFWLFDQLKQGNLALGGKTSRGLGQVDVEWTGIYETRIRRNGENGGSNPFADLLSTADLLHPEPAVSAEEASAPEIELPASGDSEIWKKLAGFLEEMSEIDKTSLGQKAREIGISKGNLNERLSLGLKGNRARRAWDVVLEQFVECGFLVEKGDGYALASREAEEEEAEEPAGGRSAELQKIYDRFVKAMAQLWEEDED